MAETVIEQENGTVNESQETKTFTQEEVNAIIADRLKRESTKYSDYESLKAKASKFDEMEEANKSELQKATEKADALQKKLDDMTRNNSVREIRDKIASETGVPAYLLTGESEESCRSQADAILQFAQKPNPYPTVKDGGEIQHNNTKKTAQDQFADWFSASLNN